MNNDWTPSTLYAHFSALREADQRAQQATLDAMNLRLQGMNEFRKTIEDVIGKTLTRGEAWGFLVGAIGLVFGVIAAWGTFNNN